MFKEQAIKALLSTNIEYYEKKTHLLIPLSLSDEIFYKILEE